MTRAGLAAVAIGASLAGACTADVSAGRLERCLLGVVAQRAGGESHEEALARHEATIGRPADLVRSYAHLDEPVPRDFERANAASGHQILVSVSAEVGPDRLPWARVADPDDAEADALVHTFVRGLAAYDAPILVIFHDEAQNDTAWGTAPEFIAAWRHVVDVARAEGATQVQWVWSLSAAAYPTEAPAWYPGDDYVDWIGASGFNWFTGDAVSPWRQFPAIFGPFHEWAAARGKPLILVAVSTAEHLGVEPDSPRSKATWITEAHGALEAWPEVQGFVWYDAPGPDEIRDWRVDSSPEALVAYRTLASDAHFDVSGVRSDP